MTRDVSEAIDLRHDFGWDVRAIQTAIPITVEMVKEALDAAYSPVEGVKIGWFMQALALIVTREEGKLDSKGKP